MGLSPATASWIRNLTDDELREQADTLASAISEKGWHKSAAVLRELLKRVEAEDNADPLGEG